MTVTFILYSVTVPNLAPNEGPVPTCNNFKQIKTWAVTTAGSVCVVEILTLYGSAVYGVAVQP